MECPKCGYLGFDEAPRCRNCSYDFALASATHEAALDEIDLAIGDVHAGARTSADPDWAGLSALDPQTPFSDTRQVFDAGDLDALLQKTEASGVTAPDPGPSAFAGLPPAQALPGPDLDVIDPVRVSEAPAVDLPDDIVNWPDAPSLTQPSDVHDWESSFPAASAARPTAERPAFDMAALDSLDIEPAAPVSRPVEPSMTVAGETLDRAAIDRVVRNAVHEPRPPQPAVFGGAPVDEDAPLVKLQQPRAPVAVRKTPMSPKLRAVSRPTPQEPAFDFLDQLDPATGGSDEAGEGRAFVPTSGLENSPPLRRLAATAIDAVLFAGIDLAVLYLTFRIVGLGAAEWRVLPVWPLVLFLVGMKLSYASVFTALGGQTIGKMAAGIRVVSMDDSGVTAGTAVRRTLASLVAVATAGIGYLPGLVGRERRAIHDRVSGTRVVLLPAA